MRPMKNLAENHTIGVFKDVYDFPTRLQLETQLARFGQRVFAYNQTIYQEGECQYPHNH